jgi:hypothetical protein
MVGRTASLDARGQCAIESWIVGDHSLWSAASVRLSACLICAGSTSPDLDSSTPRSTRLATCAKLSEICERRFDPLSCGRAL